MVSVPRLVTSSLGGAILILPERIRYQAESSGHMRIAAVSVFAVVMVALSMTASAQDQDLAVNNVKSTARGLFVGASVYRMTSYPPEDSEPPDAQSGTGFDVTVGYGLNQRVSLFADVGRANLGLVGLNTEARLLHYDGGVRLHFLAGRHRIVPFVQAGVSARVLQLDLLLGPSSRLSADSSGIGGVFGGGVNAHLAPSLAITAKAALSAGRFTRFNEGGTNVSGDSFSAMSTRVGLGVIWFPRGMR